MGHPRRLSPLFFTQEKLKLAEFRKLRRRPDHEQVRFLSLQLICCWHAPSL
jgi:hypothetical protein